jgi:NTP pyrophosphatase (non-canonical NTP hydrolase)
VNDNSNLPPGVSASNPMIVGEFVSDDLMIIFEEQLALQVSTFGDNPAMMDDRQRVSYVTNMLLGAMEELGEVLQEIRGWKAHRPFEEPGFDPKRVGSEARDALQFIVNILLACGWTSEDLIDSLHRKWQVNHNRLTRPTQQCPTCGQSADDSAPGFCTTPTNHV